MKPRILGLTLLSICVITTLVFVSHRVLSARSSETNQQSESQEKSGRGPVRMVRFVLSEDGIYPRSMQIDKGLVNIALEDRTNGSEGLLIESVVGEQRTRITQVRRAEKHWRGREVIRLTPGRYLVSDASQPEHQAELTVNP